MAMAGEPGCGFEAVNVTVTKLRFHMSASAAAGDAGWTEIALQPARRINIAQLNNGAIQNLGTAALVPGHYAQARLVLDPNLNNDTTNSVVVAGTSTEVPLQTQAVAPEGIAIGPGFDLANGQSMNLIADFDACRSVAPILAGQYILRPVITPLPTVKNGIEGYVDTSLLGSQVRVTAQQGGVIVRATVPDPATGKFSLSRLDPGSYDVVLTASGRAASVISAVPVASALSTTPLNTAATPITAAAGATGHFSAIMRLNPESSVQPAFGSASQSFGAGTTVVIVYRMGNLATGAVTFAKLPMIAPKLAVYSATSPLAFTDQPNVLPGVATYIFQSSAPGYLSIAPLTSQATAD